METYLTFTSDDVGSYDIFCTEYCGLGHSGMISRVIVMPEKDFDSWYGAVAPATEETGGLKLLEEKGCLGCHSTDGSKKIGPTFKGIFGRKETVLTGGKEREIIVDDAYLNRSVREPQADIVKGYPPVMPALQVPDEELETIVSYLKTMK
jgi:cytochrome c oxidase subunit 2